MDSFLFGGILVLVVLIPVFLADRWCRKHKQRQNFLVPKGMAWLQYTAVWTLYHLPKSIRESPWLKGNADTAGSKLNPGVRTGKYIYEQQTQKIMMIYGTILCTGMIILGYGLIQSGNQLENYEIRREEANGSAQEIILDAEIEGRNQKEQLKLTVEPRQYSEREIEVLLTKVKEYIDQQILSGNADLNNISEDMTLPQNYPGENVVIEWRPEDYNLIQQDGSLGDLTDYQFPVETRITAIIYYGGQQYEYEKRLIIVGKKKTDEELMREKLLEAVRKADGDSAVQQELLLPQSLDGRRILWSYHKESLLPILVFLGIGIMICMPLYQNQRLKDKLQKRSQQLLYDYPGFVHKMILLLGAGLTVRKSWNYVEEDYRKNGHLNIEVNWLYKEMHYTSIQIQSGISEVEAYLDFGRRIELPQYMKFSQLMMQYIRKGSRGMKEMMTQEVYEAEKQRRDIAKQLGEIAGTKLLIPMMLLLMIVLLVVMFPAFMSM